MHTLIEVAWPLVVMEYMFAGQGVQEVELAALQDPAGHRVSHENNMGEYVEVVIA